MNINEIKDAIVVREIKQFSKDCTMFIAELALSRSAFVTNEVIQYGHDIIPKVHSDLKESILRDLYEDRRKVMHAALMDAFSCLRTTPFGDPKEILTIRDKLITAAGRSIPHITREDELPTNQ